MPSKTELVLLPEELFELTEKIRKELGFNSRSSFYRYCIIKVLDEMNVLSTKAKNGLFKELGVKRVG